MSALGVRLIAAVSVALSFAGTAFLVPHLLDASDVVAWQASFAGGGIIMALAVFAWSLWVLPMRAPGRAASRMFPFRLSGFMVVIALLAASMTGMYFIPRPGTSGPLAGAITLFLLLLPAPMVFLIARRVLRPALIDSSRRRTSVGGRRQHIAWGLIIATQLPIMVCGLAMVLIEQNSGEQYERSIATWHQERYTQLLHRAGDVLGLDKARSLQAALHPPPRVRLALDPDGRLTGQMDPPQTRALGLRAPFLMLVFIIGLTLGLGRWLSGRITSELEAARLAIDAIQGGVPAQTAVKGLDRAVANREMSGLVGAVQLALSGFEHRRLALRRAAQRRRASEQAKARFLRHLSHELKSPLNSILGFSELLLAEIDGPITPRQRDQLGAVWRSGEELERYILTLLDLARLEEAGRAAALLDPTPQSARSLAQSVRDQLRPDPLGHRTIEVLSTGDAPCTIDLEPTARAIRLAVGLLSDCLTHGDLSVSVGPSPGGGVRVDMAVRAMRGGQTERLDRMRRLANLDRESQDAGEAEACVHLLGGMMAAQGGQFALEFDDRGWPRCWLELPAA